MFKREAVDGQITYGKGVPFAISLVILIPAGCWLSYRFGGPLIAYPVVTLIGLAGFFVGAFGERLMVDTRSRAIERSRSFLGKHTHFESIPFSAVKPILVLPHFERVSPNKVRQTGAAKLLLQWQANGKESGVTVTLDSEQEAREEAERLAGILGVTVSYETAA